MPIKLLINITPIRKPLTGIGYYTLNILTELLKKDIDVLGLQNGRVVTKEALQQLADSFLTYSGGQNTNGKSFKRIVVEFIRAIPGSYQLKNRLLSYRARRTLAQLAAQNYVYFEPSFIPFDYAGKTITTVHDLSFVSYPQFHPETRVAYLTAKIGASIDKSDHVIVDSDYILDEMHHCYPSSKNKSSTVYLGVDEQFRGYSQQECDSVNHTLGLQYQQFILSVATLEPRKNLKRLVLAYKRLPDEIRTKHPLVLVGDQGWKNTELVAEAEELIDSKQLIFTGYLSDRDLKHLYSSAMIFAYPSLYEGFGLPIVEAMASGAPVITSNRGATAEVSGHAALLVNPEDEEDIAQAMLQLINQPELRAQLSASEIEFVKRYQWRNTVEEILEIANSISNK
ncbi:glycosyltransferase family 4 protein [Vibrio fluvialis]|uniref:glycosyltransferase family 4 protein n=1 Tax=Vibrio fluvialis TaxID=676 RepID=UPI00192AA97B|nr:glycosyltransferase family 1 protein [Vibrio fluvialis]MBL4307080.1 glycosyltransferase family 4 protein [Vibrio fluvialis]MBY7847286.1 glycosyltransferase family 4 protein [Vibrio fluvialis]MBY8082964.1 glycosyltransferase family 4 protein [Vibrio fluvialis]